MNGQDVPQTRYTAIVPLNVCPWTKFCAIFPLIAKIKSTKGFVATSNDQVVSCDVGPCKRQATTPSLYSPHDATADQSAMIWKTNASHNVILDHRFVMISVETGVAADMEIVYVMDILTRSSLGQTNAVEKWKKTVR